VLQAKQVLPLVRLLVLLVPLQVLLVPLLVPLALPQVLLARQVPPPRAPASSPPPQSLACRLAPSPQLARLSRQLPWLQAITATAPPPTTDRCNVAQQRRAISNETGPDPGLFFLCTADQYVPRHATLISFAPGAIENCDLLSSRCARHSQLPIA
jgi:hypothetical protein